MKLQVLTWLRDSLIGLTGKTIELIFRTILFCLPLGIYILLIQFRSKASKVSNISVFTNDNSVWQHIFPGFILVAVNPNLLKESYFKFRRNFQMWVNDNKFLLFFIMLTIVFALTFLVFYMILMLKGKI